MPRPTLTYWCQILASFGDVVTDAVTGEPVVDAVTGKETREGVLNIIELCEVLCAQVQSYDLVTTIPMLGRIAILVRRRILARYFL